MSSMAPGHVGDVLLLPVKLAFKPLLDSKDGGSCLLLYDRFLAIWWMFLVESRVNKVEPKNQFSHLMKQ